MNIIGFFQIWSGISTISSLRDRAKNTKYKVVPSVNRTVVQLDLVVKKEPWWLLCPGDHAVVMAKRGAKVRASTVVCVSTKEHIVVIIKLVSILTRLCSNERVAAKSSWKQKFSLQAPIDDGGRKQFPSLRAVCHFLFRPYCSCCPRKEVNCG